MRATFGSRKSVALGSPRAPQSSCKTPPSSSRRSTPGRSVVPAFCPRQRPVKPCVLRSARCTANGSRHRWAYVELPGTPRGSSSRHAL